MTIDERLDRLTERHEPPTERAQMRTKDVQALTSLVKEIAVGTARLLHAVEGHELSISDLGERNRPQI